MGARPSTTTGIRAGGTATIETVLPATPLRGANGMACRDGRLVVAEAAANRLSSVGPDGSVARIDVPEGLRGPDDLVFDEAGTLYVTAMASGEVWRRDPSGRWEPLPARIPGANGIALDEQGRLLVSQAFFSDGIQRLDPAQPDEAEPIARDIGEPNAMTFTDGALIAPLMRRDFVARIDPKTGAHTVLARGLGNPHAVRPGPAGLLTLLADGSIHSLTSLVEERPAPLVGRVAPGADNLVRCGRSVLVSNHLTGAIDRFASWPGQPVPLVPGGLVTPRGITRMGADLMISDAVSIKRLRAGRLELVAGLSLDDLPLPGPIAALGDSLFIASTEAGEIHRFDPVTKRSSLFVSGLDQPSEIIASRAGDLLVIERRAGRVLRISGIGTMTTVGSGLIQPRGLAEHGARVFTAEALGGRILALREGELPVTVATGFSGPSGLTVDARGRLYVVESRARRLRRLGTDGVKTSVAENLPVSPARDGSITPVPITAEPDGTLLVAFPEDGSLVRLRP